MTACKFCKPETAKTMGRPPKLTVNERVLLGVILSLELRSGRHHVTGPQMARAADTTPQGAHQTAGSLVRKGMLERQPASATRGVGYRVTVEGVRYHNRSKDSRR